MTRTRAAMRPKVVNRSSSASIKSSMVTLLQRWNSTLLTPTAAAGVLHSDVVHGPYPKYTHHLLPTNKKANCTYTGSSRILGGQAGSATNSSSRLTSALCCILHDFSCFLY